MRIGSIFAALALPLAGSGAVRGGQRRFYGDHERAGHSALTAIDGLGKAKP